MDKPETNCVRVYWKSDGKERPPITLSDAVDDLYALNHHAQTREEIEKSLRAGKACFSPCAEYIMARPIRAAKVLDRMPSGG